MSDLFVRPDVQAFLDMFKASPMAADASGLAVDDLRQAFVAMRPPPGCRRPLSIVHDLRVDFGSGGLTDVRLYDRRADRGEGPVIVFYHGGGFVIGDLESHDTLCRTIADQIDLPVVAIDYPLAPEQPFPAASDAAEAAARWVAAAGGDILGRHASAIILAGDSAGGNLAAVTAAALRDRPAAVPVRAQLLLYPVVSKQVTTPSRDEFSAGYFLTSDLIAWFYSHYSGPMGDPRADLFAIDPAGLPPTVVVTMRLDPLRDEGRRYAGRLAEAGVPVAFLEAAGAIHGSFSMEPPLPSLSADLDKAIHLLGLFVEG